LNGTSAYYTAGNVGIGTSSPQATLHAQSGSYSSTPRGGGNSRFLFTMPGTTVGTNYFELQAANTADTSILFSSGATGNNFGVLRYDATVSAMSIWTNATQQLTITSAGNMGLGTTSPVSFGAGAVIQTVAGTTTYGGYLGSTNSVTVQMWANEGGLTGYLGTRTNHPLLFTINNAEVGRFNTSGYLGIGTTSPNNKLVVSNGGVVGLEISPTGGYTGLGGVDFLSYNRSASVYAPIGFITNSNNNSMSILTNGKVGISTTSPSQLLSVAGTMSATTYYDYNNTSYYAVPSATSQFNTVNINYPYVNGPIIRQAAATGWLSGNYSSSESGSTTGAIYSIGGSYYPTSTSLNNMYGIGYANSFTGGYVSSAWGLYVASSGTIRHYLDSDNGVAYHSASVRSPIFYDLDNTGYYVDPNNTSNVNYMQAINYSTAAQGNPGIADSFYCGNWYRSVGPSGWYNQTYSVGIYATDSTWVRTYNNAQFYSGSIIQAGASVRGPIFYDTDNTGYYLDPASTSNLNNLQVSNTFYANYSGTPYHTNVNFGFSGTDYKYKYILLAKVPTFGNSNTNVTIKGKFLFSRTNNLGITADAEISLNIGYGNNVYFNMSNSGGTVLQLVNYTYNGTAYLALYAYTAPNWSWGNFYGEIVNYGSWLDSNLFTVVEVSSSNHTSATYTSNGSTFNQPVTATSFYASGSYYYDGSNTSYYVAPSGTSVLSTVTAYNVGCNNGGSSSSGYGLSLYNGAASFPQYGILFQGTATMGTHGSVTADWATYFTVDTTSNRGWIFKGGTVNSTSYNVASINNSGTAVFNGNVTAYSDIRVKKNIKVIGNALYKVQQLRGVTFDRTDDERIGRQTGVIAQEVLKVLPEAVLGSEETQYSVAYGNMVGLLIEAIKEQQAIIDSQEARLQRLEELLKK